MLPKSTLGIAAASAGIGFVLYCIYFDRRRRNDPNFKQKLKEREYLTCVWAIKDI